MIKILRKSLFIILALLLHPNIKSMKPACDNDTTFYYHIDPYIDCCDGLVPDTRQTELMHTNIDQRNDTSMALTLAVLMDRVCDIEQPTNSQSTDQSASSYPQPQEHQSSHEFYSEMARDNALDAGKDIAKFEASQDHQQRTHQKTEQQGMEPVSAEPQFSIDGTVDALTNKVESSHGRQALEHRIHQINRQESGFHIFGNMELAKERIFIGMVQDGTVAKLLKDIHHANLPTADRAFEILNNAWPYKHAAGYIVPREISGAESRLMGLLGGDFMQKAERCLVSRPDYQRAHGDRIYSEIVAYQNACDRLQKNGEIQKLMALEQQFAKALEIKQGRFDIRIKARFVIVQKILSQPLMKSYSVVATGSFKQAKQEMRYIEQQIFSHFAQQGITDPAQINALIPETPYYETLIIMHRIFEARADIQAELEVGPITHLYPVADLEQALTDNSKMLDIYREHNFGNPARIETRIEKYTQIAQSNIILSHQTYELSSDAIGMLSKECIDPNLYLECSGNQLQQQVHQECVSIIEKVALPNDDIVAREYYSSIVHLADAARQLNQANSPIEAMDILDVCWSILDCCKAAGEGIIEGTIGTVINHPIEAALCVCAPQYLVAYHLGKIACVYLDVKITSLMDKEAGEQKLVDYLQPFIDCVDTISKGDVTLRGSIKVAATVATQVVVRGKVDTGLKMFYESTKKQAKNYLKNNPAATAKQYLVTPDGRILQAAGGPGKNTMSLRDMGGKGPGNGSSGGGMGGKWPKNANNAARPMDYGHSVIQSEQLKDALQNAELASIIEEFKSIIDMSKHGLERLIERNFTPGEVKSLVFTPDIIRTQSNGIKAFIKQTGPDIYNFMSINERTGKVVTALKSLNKKDLIRLGKNYGWEL